MEINKLGELYTKLCQKYSYQSMEKDNDGNITEAEILSMAYQDADLKAELDDSDLELIKDFISVDKILTTGSVSEVKDISEFNNVSETKQVSSSSKKELKTMDEYMRWIDSQLDFVTKRNARIHHYCLNTK